MGNNSFISPSTTVLKLEENKFSTTGMQNIDMVRIWFEYFFTTEQSLKDQNKFFLLSLQDAVNNNNLDLLRRFLLEYALKELHPSLIKSALIMTDGVPDLVNARENATQVLNSLI